jgi:hypothetical protein
VAGAKPGKSKPGKRPGSSTQSFRMYLVPCSCGTSFSVSEEYDRHGSQWGRFLVCPGCGKRHDPKNRLLQLGYQRQGFWGVEDC